VPVEEIADEDILRFLRNRPGEQTAYRIPPFDEQEQKTLRSWLTQGLHEKLGADRSKVFMENSRYALDFWLGALKTNS